MENITKIVNYLRRQGATTINREPGEGPGGSDIEAYWESGDAWIIKVMETDTEIETIKEKYEDEIEKMWLEARNRRAQAVVAVVGEKEMIFWQAESWKLLETP
jgi:hypothetical protein